MQFKSIIKVLTIGLLGWNLNTQAALIDFEDLPSGDLNTNQVIYAEATFTSTDGTFSINSGGNQSLCAFSPNLFNCEENLNVAFNGVANNLTFETLFHNTGDEITVNVFGSGGLLGSVIASGDVLVDLTAFMNITSIDILYSGANGAGYGYDNFSFDLTSAIPEPGLVSLLILGLAGMFGVRRRV